MLQRNVQVIKFTIKSRFVAALIVGICMLGCGRRAPVEMLVESEGWRDGDLVLRGGESMESWAVMRQSRSIYSHIGMLHYDSLAGEWHVVHAVPGEDEPEYLKTEAVTQFFRPDRAQCGAWIRVNCSDSIARQAVKYALRKVEQRVIFDEQYLLQDTTRLYCTELIWCSYLAQGIDVSSGRRTSVPVLCSKEGECIFPSDIEQSGTTLFVKPFKLKSL
jgi:Orthopoxvirus protein of unknown function (DUF830).